MEDQHFSTEDERNKFKAEILEKSIIAIPLLNIIKQEPQSVINIIIDLNYDHKGGLLAAGLKVLDLIKSLENEIKQPVTSVNHLKNELSTQYIFARIPAELITELIVLDREGHPAIHKIWPDFEIDSQTIKSVRTIKADAARTSFSALGEDITWAVIDSGVDFSHRHFSMHKNKSSYYHLNLTDTGSETEDEFGHGTHVAGIIAGELISKSKDKPFVITKSKNENGAPEFKKTPIAVISGVAPKCKIVSIKVLDAKGKGQTSSLIAAIAHVQKVNNYGRDLKIHGVNLSLGYAFDPEWFACGQSPLCVEVNRLVKSGVVVVVAAGNTGYGFTDTIFNGRMATGMSLSINDPGNAELAITVGSTHREMPHTYGVSYFSSKGPTGDGRLKPDLVAPGEKIISCAAGAKKSALRIEGEADSESLYLEDSGTSMAAPHVSGAIAAFMSIRREYIGQPEKLKDIFCSTATNLNRDANFQGKGLVDLMRAIQSV